MAEIVFGFKAIKPLLAFHDGREVTFNPGDEVPAGEWKGAAVEALIENGKLMRYATNVYGPGEVGGDALASTTPASALPDDRDALLARIDDLERLVARLAAGDAVTLDDLDAVTGPPADGDEGEETPEDDGEDSGEEPEASAEPFPHHLGGGSYELSDGTHVKGKARALAAQAELDVAAEAA